MAINPSIRADLDALLTCAPVQCVREAACFRLAMVVKSALESESFPAPAPPPMADRLNRCRRTAKCDFSACLRKDHCARYLVLDTPERRRVPDGRLCYSGYTFFIEKNEIVDDYPATRN